MAFLEEVTNTSFSDFITALRVFATTTMGFTNNNLSSDNFAFGLNSDTSVFAFNPTASSLIEAKLARGLNTSALYDAQPGTQVSVPCEIDELAANYVKFLLFGDQSGNTGYVHAVIEVTAGVYKHLHFGVLDKFGTWGGGASSPGGEYMVGHSTGLSAALHSMPWSYTDIASSNDHVNVDDARSGTVSSSGYIENKFGTVSTQTIWQKSADVQQGKNGVGWFEDLYHLGQNSFSGVNPMFPILVWGVDEGTYRAFNTQLFPLGQVRDMRFISMDGLAAGDKITIGGDDWHVFPVWDKGLTKDTTDREDTGFAGFAFQEIP